MDGAVYEVWNVCPICGGTVYLFSPTEARCDREHCWDFTAEEAEQMWERKEEEEREMSK